MESFLTLINYSMATPHISAPEGAFAKTVLMPGDPLRAKFIAENFLENPQLVTSVRNMLGFTGTYKGTPVSVMASGMGIPSIGIYSWELFKFYGVENIIRIGSAGSYKEHLNVMDVVLSSDAYSTSNYGELQTGCKVHLVLPSARLNEVIRSKATELDIPLKMASVQSSDVFYSDLWDWKQIADYTHTDCVEMESFALFHNALILGKNATCLLTISDSFVSHQELTSEERQNSFTTMMKLALESAIAF